MSRRRQPEPSERKTITYTPFGAKVEQFGYRAAEIIRKSGRVQPSGGSGDYHARWDLALLRAESQRFDRDNGLYHGLINRSLDNILGDGFTLQAQTGNTRLNQRAEELWSEWWASPEIRGLDEGCEVERLVLRHLQVDGDVAALKLSDGNLQLIEAERIAYKATKANGNRVENGIELSSVGKPIRFYLAGYDDAGYVNSSKAAPVNPEDMIYIANRDRISQTRGIPCMVCNFPMLHRINDVCDAEALAWQVLSRLALAISRRDAGEMATATSEADPDATEGRDIATRYHDIGDAVIFHGEPGETVTGIERNLPGADFPESIRMFLRLLGLPLGMPLELVLLDWSNTNYSSARAALLQAYRMFKRWQRKMKVQFYSPIYRWKVAQWVREGSLPDRVTTYKHDWIAPPFPWVDPLKEAQAEGERMDRGFGLYGSVLKGQNIDPEDFVEARAAEIERAILKANELNGKYPEAKVDWRTFAGIKAEKAAPPPSAGVVNDGQDQPEKPANEDEGKPGDGPEGE